MHFLAEVPSKISDSHPPDWLKVGCVVSWAPVQSSGTLGTSSHQNTNKVTFVIFTPPPTLIPKISQLLKSGQWIKAIQDPYVLIDIIFASWYERIDKSAWEVTRRGVDIEKVSSIPSRWICRV
jgi:hypothetical protein